MKKKITIKDREKQNRAKTIVKWVFAGLGWSLLLACFIALLSLGVKGCNNKSNKTAEVSEIAPQRLSPQKAINNMGYDYLYSNTFTLEDNEESVYTSYLQNIASLLGHGDSSRTQRADILLYQSNIEGAYNTTSGFNEIFECRVTLHDIPIQQSPLTYGYILKEVVLYSNGDSQACFQSLGWVHAPDLSEYYVIFYLGGSRILLNTTPEVEDLIHVALLNPFYDFSSFAPNTFTFNEQINFNAFKSSNLEMPYINQSASGPIDVYNGFFYSGGELFNNITIRYVDAGGSKFMDKNANVIQASNGDTYYMALEYHNTYTNRSLIVNSRDYATMKEGSGIITAALLSSTWKTQAYRNILLVDNPSEQSIGELGRLNNNSSNINNGVSGAGSIAGVFDLLSSAFGSWASIFSIQLIPGLTIGVFFFLPLVVGIIVLVFRAVKK